MRQTILFILFLFICCIKSSVGIQINGYTIGVEDKLRITISGVGFKAFTKVKFQTTSTKEYNEFDTGGDSVLINTSYYYNSSFIMVIIPQTLMDCLFSVVDGETGIESNKLQLNLDMTPVFINTQTELINNSSLVITFYGNYLWKLNTLYEIIINNSPCNGITGNITGFTNRYIQCAWNVPLTTTSGTDQNQQLKNTELISTIKIGNWNGVFNFYITQPTLNSVSLNNYRELMVNGSNLISPQPFSMYWNNEIDITDSCYVYSEVDNQIQCIISDSILEQSTLNQYVPIKIKVYGVISNLINLQIRPIINIEQSRVLILPLVNQPISINGFFYLSSIDNGDEIIVNLKNNETNEIGQCNNPILIDPTNIKCNLPESFVSLSISVIISINGIESDPIEPFSYLEPSALYATYINNITIQISGRNIVSAANILYNQLPLQCIQSGEIGKSINCTFVQQPAYCVDSNCFSTCSTSIVYNDGIFNSMNLNYYPPPTINSLLLNGTHIIVNAIIQCDRINPVDYLSYYVAVDLDNTRISPISYNDGIFIFPYAPGQLPNQDIFYIKFYFATGFSSYIYQIIQPTIKSVSSQNGVLTIYGDYLSKTTKFTYGTTDISCDLPKQIIDPTSSDANSITIINCYLPTSCLDDNVNCFTNCGEIGYYGTFYNGSINYFLPPTINSLEFTFDKTLAINGSLHCDLFTPPDLYSQVKLLTNAKNDGTNYQLLNYNNSIYTFQFHNKPQPNFKLFLSFFNVNSNGYQVNLPDPIIEGAEYINEQFIIIGNNLSSVAKISYQDEQLYCNITTSIYDEDTYTIFHCTFSNSTTQCLNCINQCGFIKYQDQFSNDGNGINYRFFVEPVLYNAVVVKKKSEHDNTFYLSFISINGSINCQDVPSNYYNQLNLLAHFEKSLVPFMNYSESSSLFRFDFVEKQLTIPSKDSFNLFFSLGFDGISSNIVKFNSDSIIDETDYTDHPNNSILISISMTMPIIISVILQLLL